MLTFMTEQKWKSDDICFPGRNTNFFTPLEKQSGVVLKFFKLHFTYIFISGNLFNIHQSACVCVTWELSKRWKGLNTYTSARILYNY